MPAVALVARQPPNGAIAHARTADVRDDGTPRYIFVERPTARSANSRAARFLDANCPASGPPNVASEAGMVEPVAAGQATHDEVVDRIGKRRCEKGDEPPAIS